MDVPSSVARFFNNSPNRQLTLDKFIDELRPGDSESSKQRKLKDLCRTRWVELHDAFEAFAELYEPTVSCLEEITHGWMLNFTVGLSNGSMTKQPVTAATQL